MKSGGCRNFLDLTKRGGQSKIPLTTFFRIWKIFVKCQFQDGSDDWSLTCFATFSRVLIEIPPKNNHRRKTFGITKLSRKDYELLIYDNFILCFFKIIYVTRRPTECFYITGFGKIYNKRERLLGILRRIPFERGKCVRKWTVLPYLWKTLTNAHKNE